MSRNGVPMNKLALAYGMSFAVMWSSAFTSARIIVASAPPFYSLSLRFLLSGLFAIGIALALGQSWSLSAKQWRAVIVFGLCQNALYLGLNFLAMTTIAASLAAIIASSMPLMVALASWVILRQKMSALGIAGLMGGFAGVFIIMATRLTGEAELIGILLCALGAIALTFATMVMGNAMSGGQVLMIVGLQMLVGAVVLAPVAVIFEEPVFEPSLSLFLAFTYTLFVPGTLATLVWFLLVAEIGPAKAATFHFLNPVFGVLVAAIFLNERIGIMDVLGVLVIAVSILAVQLAKQKTI